jgi:hypothetical protein
MAYRCQGGLLKGIVTSDFEVGGRRDEGENLHRKRDGQSGQTGQMIGWLNSA